MPAKSISVLIALMLSLCIVESSHAFWWMFYLKPAFNGRVIDAETKKPIEGAVVVVTYPKETRILPEHYSSIIKVRETLTDKDGNFHIPSYTTIIQPLSTEEDATFIIFKPGYGSFPNYHTYPPKLLSTSALEEFFSGKAGTEGEILNDFDKVKVTFGVVELPRLRTREEREKADMIAPTDNERQWPLLHEMIKKEDEWLKNNKGWGR